MPNDNFSPLLPSRFREASYDCNLWRCTVEADRPFDQVLKPDFWVLIAPKVRPTDIIQVLAEDGTYFAELLVVDASAKWVKVKVLRKVELSAEEAAPLPSAGEYQILFRGSKRWSVKRKSDNAVLSEGHQTQDAAAAWLGEHQKVLAA